MRARGRTKASGAAAQHLARSDLDEPPAAIRSDNAILFVGAGVSMSVGLPSWSTLARVRAE